jgi:hypothetical protein
MALLLQNGPLMHLHNRPYTLVQELNFFLDPSVNISKERKENIRSFLKTFAGI